jgi:hypothetical protein
MVSHFLKSTKSYGVKKELNFTKSRQSVAKSSHNEIIGAGHFKDLNINDSILEEDLVFDQKP